MPLWLGIEFMDVKRAVDFWQQHPTRSIYQHLSGRYAVSEAGDWHYRANAGWDCLNPQQIAAMVKRGSNVHCRY